MSDSRQGSKQEALWRGQFGEYYTDRNALSKEGMAALLKQWTAILDVTTGAPPRSILEVGANIGLNLRAISQLSQAEFYALEPNGKARSRLIDDAVLPAANVHDGICSSIPLETGSVDLAFTSGVLIHIHPDNLLDSLPQFIGSQIATSPASNIFPTSPRGPLPGQYGCVVQARFRWLLSG